jgi:hypothetical protein
MSKLEILKEVVARDECILQHEYNKVIMNTRIIFTCGTPNCGITHNKSFESIRVSGGYCKACTMKRRLEKIKATNVLKYGVENPFQSETIKQKIAETNLEKYGVEYAMQNGMVQQKIKETNLTKYGVENPFQATVCKEKAKQTMMTKYGVANPQQCLEIKNRTIQTVQDRYGARNPMQNTEVQQKGKDTCILKYGVANPFQSEQFKEKSRQTCMEKYGVNYVSQSIDFQQQIVKTNMERYGVPRTSQCPDVIERQFKAACRLKDYTYSCGKVVQVQGYEPFALNDLIAMGHTSKDIVTEKKEVPEIWYDKDGKRHRYFCDIYLPNEDKMIEVKSTWTYTHHTGNIQEKARATVKAGYEYEIWVYQRDGKKEVVKFTQS